MSKANPNFTYLKENVPNQRTSLLQGGTRSGKTFATLHYLIHLCKSYPDAGMEIDIVRDTFTALKATVWKDMYDLLNEYGLYNSRFHNKTDHVYFLFGNTINYYGADNPDKIHGRSRDILYINEAHQFPENVIDQLFPRTRHRVIADYNPALGVDHWLDPYIAKYPPLITTYRDNPHLTKSQVEEIESRKDNPYWWEIYGTGQRCKPQGVILDNWIEGKFPEGLKTIFGQDYGYSKSGDPSALVEVFIDRKRKIIFAKECFYERSLTTNDLFILNSKFAKKSLIVGDRQEARLIDDLSNRGNNIVKCIKGQGSVNAGIKLLQDFKIIVDPSSVNLKKELTNYTWMEKKSETPIDDWNHLIDALRYAVSYALMRRSQTIKVLGTKG